MGKEIVPLNGHVRIRAWELQEDGTEKMCYDETKKNLIVTVGKASILKGLTNGDIAGGGYPDGIGTGDSTTAAAVGQTDLQASTNKLWKDGIIAADKIYTGDTLYLSMDFGYTEANWTWNEIGLRDNNDVLIARQVDGTPFVKTSSKRALVEWQLGL